MARKDLVIIYPFAMRPRTPKGLSGFGHCVMRMEAVVDDWVRIVGAGSGEQLRCDHHGGEQIDKGYANPHQGARSLLVLEGRNTEMPSPGQVARIDNAAAEGKKRGERVARQCGKEKV